MENFLEESLEVSIKNTWIFFLNKSLGTFLSKLVKLFEIVLKKSSINLAEEFVKQAW